MDDAPRRSWFARNWLWVVPVGCLTPVLICGGGIVAILSVVFGAIKSSEPYSEAVARAKADDRVVALLGEPVEPSYFVDGNIQVSGAGGNADLMIPVSGPKGSAKLYVSGKKEAGKWTYTKMEVEPAGGGPRIDLLAKPE